MKKLLVLFLFIGTLAQAQYSVKGTLSPSQDFLWILLYKVEGARQIFVKNTQIKKETQQKDGKEVTVGTFEFELPADAKVGSYRVTYDLQRNGFIDFLFNKENVSFTFDPSDPEAGASFTTSSENKLYNEFLSAISVAQYKVDSVQVAYLKNPTKKLEDGYKQAVTDIRSIQKRYALKSEGKLAHDFINATDRYNSPTVAKTSKEYMTGVVTHFFDKIDFSNQSLFNSSFLIDRVTDYVFYMNYSEDVNKREEGYMKAVDIAIDKVNDVKFKGDVIQFLISQFSAMKSSTLVDYLFANHFDKLPVELQNAEFKKRIEAEMAVSIGKTAPDFDWDENGNKMSLSTLDDGENYLLIFYSTGCSHCLREVPKIFEFLKDKKKTKVIAFAMETSDDVWKNYQKQFTGWHHVLGLNKWENTTARTYQIRSTPTYFVLNKDKKIIANPDKLEELKVILTGLN